MAQKLKLNLCHLYPDLMDTYGDIGNVLAIKQRCKWRGINIKTINSSINENINFKDIDLFFFGGGQDKIQFLVGKDLAKKKVDLLKAIENNAVMLSICGGYQLLQNYFKTANGKSIKGIGLFNAHTEGAGNRMVQNLLININPNFSNQIHKIYPTTQLPLTKGWSSSGRNYPTTQLIGFENHSGKTYLEGRTQPLGHVVKGSGNNGEDGTEGAVYKNAIGCYLHGSLLPKNPHLTDYLIAKAIERKHGKIELAPLDDEIEWQAHNQSVNRSRSQS